ncbi:ABC transporter substrate-binding protein [Paenibacillus sp. L3-i20]|uniref:ABC transporter substrate-binding protein n=1 Tax=Paenibacillus sp. L3-i20 TaxID=2905833 RepID=UPI001EDCB64D|nr:ABC transporter substrate-binding protein [Paenibacillus sp. L3-i20]GKU76759.1 iron-hydroxamate ABC transporter substrate-binding protein [Paenibacillus sp. L3-i20]
MNTIALRCKGILAVALIASGILTGCSASATTSGSTNDGGHTFVDFAERKVVLPSIPERIVALGNGEVDIVTALGGNLVGRPDNNGGLPNDTVKDVPIVGSVHTVDLERIASLQPDVVLGNYPININDVPQLESIGSKVVLTHANSVADIKRQIQLFGEILHQESKATEIINQMDKELDAAKLILPKDKQRVLFVYGAPGTYLAALPNSLAGDLLEAAGGVNVAAEYPRMQNFPQYAQLNTERVVEASPDIILIMTHGSSEKVEQGFIHEMEGNPAWSSLAAVREGRIHVLPAELFGTNPGTKVAQAIKHLGELLAS